VKAKKNGIGRFLNAALRHEEYRSDNQIAQHRQAFRSISRTLITEMNETLL
jgi:hypothetical protein